MHISSHMVIDLSNITRDCLSIIGYDSKIQSNQPVRSQSLYCSLYGVVEHSGGLTGGHYTACVKVRPDLQDLQDFQHFFSPSLSRPGQSPISRPLGTKLLNSQIELRFKI